ncbi:MAG: glycosyl hydrolase, partial [Candidatus Eremiobacteraeota bacterium]|nr:glycosyl hydrolase [Candidatus Eremiobacteraeota bacterium]
MCAFLGAAAAGSAASPSPSPSGSPSPTPSPVPTAKPVYQSMTWREIGPALPGGRVANVAGSATDPDLYYAASAGGGVWKTTDAGLTWKAVFEKEAVASIGDVVIDPTDDKTVWVGTGEGNPRNDVIPGGGVYKSIDGGATWKKMGLEATRTITRVLIDPSNPTHVIVAAQGDVYAPSTERGVYVTFDSGATWTKTLYVSDQAGASDVALDPHHPNVVYAGIWHFIRKPWTTNSGGSDDGLYKSTDGGRTWTELTGHGLPDGTLGRIGLAVAPSTGRVYALIEAAKGILWRSDDAGANWTLVSSDTLVNQRPFYFSHVVVDPQNADRLYSLSAAFSVSTDGGKTFKPSFGSPHGDYHGLWIAPNSKRMIIAEDGGIGISLDRARTWSFARNMPIGEVYHVGVGATGNPYWICGGWQDNNGWCGPSFTTDPSGILNKHWVNVTGGDGQWAIPDPIDPEWLWADSQQGFISVYNRRTHDQYSIQPYVATNEENFDQRLAKYRFNWDSPIAFAPWDGHVAWLAGNAI